jgi:hypothetical protein
MDIRQIVKKKYKVNTLFSLDNTKASKSSEFGYLNGIQYLLHANTGAEYGIKNMCAFASKGCSEMCFGGARRQAFNNVWEAKKNRSLLLQNDKELYLAFFVDEVIRLKAKAIRDGKKLALRLNGTSDKDFEKMGLYHIFPDVQFCEYTKNPIQVKKYLKGELPKNLHLTLSRSEKNHEFCMECLRDGGINVAIPFAGDRPDNWMGFPTLDGDKHDLRFLDENGGHVVALSFKNWDKHIEKGLNTGFLLKGVLKAPKKVSEKTSANIHGEVGIDQESPVEVA